jgi:hypothetical protein
MSLLEEYDRINSEHKKCLEELKELVKVHRKLQQRNLALRGELLKLGELEPLSSSNQDDESIIDQFKSLPSEIMEVTSILTNIQVPEPLGEGD